MQAGRQVGKPIGRLVSQHINRVAVMQVGKHYKSISLLLELSYNIKQHKPNFSLS